MYMTVFVHDRMIYLSGNARYIQSSNWFPSKILPMIQNTNKKSIKHAVKIMPKQFFNTNQKIMLSHCIHNAVKPATFTKNVCSSFYLNYKVGLFSTQGDGNVF